MVLVFLVLTAVYFVVTVYSRSVRRERLMAEYDEELRAVDRETFVAEGLKEYDRSLRRKAIVLVYIVPMGVILALIYFTNFS